MARATLQLICHIGSPRNMLTKRLQAWFFVRPRVGLPPHLADVVSTGREIRLLDTVRSVEKGQGVVLMFLGIETK